jgi:DNA-binding MurR/RpiR family transcriptional regulator
VKKLKGIDSLIREKKEKLTGKKRRIAKYILDNYLQVAFLTAA